MTKRIVGTGKYSYEVVWPFGRLPAGMQFGNVSHIAVDSADQIYVYQKQDPPILVFDSDGNFISGWGEGLILDAHGICISRDNEIFLVDRDAHEVLKLNAAGEVLLRLGARARPSWQAPFNHPSDVAVAPTGEIYVSDGYGNSAIHKFSATGELVLTWGSPGSGPGELFNPHAVWVDKQNRVYVADQEKNHRIQIFDADGGFITEWHDFYTPMDIYSDADGTIYVTDYIPRLTVLDAEGNVLSRGRTPVAAHGIWGDSRGNLYCAGNLDHVAKLVRL